MLGILFGGWVIILMLGMLGLFLIPLGVALFAFWIWMLINCIKNENISGNEKVAWVLVIALTHLLGAIIYFFAGRTRRRAMAAPPLA